MACAGYAVSAVSLRKTSSSLASFPASAILRRLSSAPRAIMLPLSIIAILVALMLGFWLMMLMFGTGIKRFLNEEAPKPALAD